MGRATNRSQGVKQLLENGQVRNIGRHSLLAGSRGFGVVLGLVICGASGIGLSAESFQLPTDNRTLYEKGGGEHFFVGTVGKSWETGTFGCVRSDGWQMHEGLDIRCVHRDRHGEPSDEVRATADGVVVYLSRVAGNSNYGRYAVVRHVVEGIEVYSLYAHLQDFLPETRVGRKVRAGEAIAVMGRTSNTRQRISKDRAHVHFELNLLASDRFEAWFARHAPGQKNDHGLYNGQNLLGLDPRWVLLAQREHGTRFSLVQFLRSQPELCRVRVRAASFPWVQRYGGLVERSPRAEREGVAGYDLSLNFNGVPFKATARSSAELGTGARSELLSVNAEEARAHPCRKLVQERAGVWQLGGHGIELLELLTH